MSRHRTRLALAVASVLTLCLGTLAWAGWSSAAHGVGAAQAAWVPAPTKPEVARAATGVEVSWDPTSVGGTVATAYLLERRNTVSGAVRAATGGCAGRVAALTCVDDVVAPGTWTYRVRALLGPWTGPWSVTSAPVTVEGSTAAGFTLTPAGATSGDRVTVAGTGWPETETVTVEVGPSQLCTATTDAAGAFGAECAAPSLAQGSYPTRAFAGDVVTTGAAFTVVPGLREVTSVVSEGGTLRVRGRGFAASSRVTLSIDQWTGPLKEVVASSSGDTGLVSVTVPAGTDAGEHELRVADNAGNSATATFTAVTAGLEVSPGSAAPGTPVRLTGANWPAGGTVNIQVRDVPLCTPVADANGVVDTTCTLPDTPAGATEVVAASAGVVKRAAFTVLSTVSTSSPTTSSGSTLTVTGRGFGGSTSGTLTIGGTTVTPTSPIATTSSGRVSTTVKVPALDAGPHEVRLTDSRGNTATTTITVVTPQIALSQSSGTAQSTIKVGGQNWPAGATVGVSVGGGQACLFTADAQGSFAPGNCAIALIAGGPQTVTANGGGASITMPGAFTVLPRFVVSTIARGTPGQTISFQGTGLPASGDARFTIGGIEVAAARANNVGQTTVVTATVPDLPAGTVPAQVSGALGASAEVPFGVFRPTVELDASVIRPSVTRVRVTGAGWPADVPVELLVGNQTFCGGVWTTASGMLDFSCTPQNLPGGAPLSLVARNGSVHAVIPAEFTVQATLSLSSSTVKAGGSLGFAARGLTPGKAAELVVDGSVLATGAPGTNGLWTRSVTIPPDTPSGPVEVTVRQEGMSPVTVVITVT